MISTVLLSVALVTGGKPAATIVVPEKPTLNESFAAGELRYWVKEITGAELPISTPAAPVSGLSSHVLIGRRLAPEAFADDMKALEGTEGFAVREKDGSLYLFGAKPCGNAFAVYELLERTSDIIWPSLAKDVDRIFTPTKDLEAKDVACRMIPALAERCWSINNGYYYNDPRTEHYALRQKSDSAKGSTARWKAFGFDSSDWSGHNIYQYLPWDRLGKTHPEYFCMVDGVRMPGGYSATGTCYTSPEAVKELAKNFIRDRIEGGLPATMVGLGIEDANQECCCPECLKPIPLPDGTLLRKEDDKELFCSALYYRWFNNVAREIAKTHPEVTLNTFAYMFTTTPPPFPVEKNVVANFCSIARDTRHPLDAPCNKKAMAQLLGWEKQCGRFSLYEYWGCGARYPRPVEYIVQKDLRVALQHGVFRTGSEWIHKNGAEYVSAMSFWVANRLMWNPQEDIEKLRDEFFAKAFRGAAKEMRTFYDTVRDSWFKLPYKSTWSEDPVVEITALLKDKPAAAKAFGALKAADAKATHPASKLLIAKIRETMEGHRAKALKAMDAKRDVEIPFSADPLSLASPEGTGWANATVLLADAFENAPLEAAMANDGAALWFRLKSSGKPEKGRNIWLSDHWEIFLATAAAGYPYFHFAVDAEGSAVSERAFGVKSAVKASVVAVQKESDGWRVIVKIPMEKLVIKDDALRLMLVHRDGKTQRNVGWRGGEWHEPATFVKTVIGKKEGK